jgi:hypothetical protein
MGLVLFSLTNYFSLHLVTYVLLCKIFYIMVHRHEIYILSYIQVCCVNYLH